MAEGPCASSRRRRAVTARSWVSAWTCFPPVRSIDAGGLGGLWPLARYNRCKRTHAGQAFRASFGHNNCGAMTVVRQIGCAAREEDDANESPTALAVGALF